MGGTCSHGRIRPLCAECRPTPREDFLRALGWGEPHALTDLMRQRRVLPYHLKDLEHLGDRDPDSSPIRNGGHWSDAEWAEARARYPQGTRWAWLREGVLDRDGHRCQVCGPTNGLQVDHILPFSKGGSNRFRNLWTLCVGCHSRKTGRDLERPDPARRRREAEVAGKLRGRERRG